MKRLLFLGAVVGALLTFGTAADAGVRFQFGGHHGHHGGWRGHYGAPAYGYRRYPTYHRQWHDTSHYDYHPGGFQRHRNHYHYVPGHYDFHRSGHWHGHFHH